MKKPFHVSPYLLLTLANLFWAGNWVISRAFRGELPPIALSFWRWVVALLCLLPFALPHVRRDWPQLRAAWPWLLFLGALGTGGYNVLVYGGLQYTTAINGTLLNSFVPVMIVLIAWLAQGKRLHGREAAGILVSFIGVLAIVAHGDWQRLRELTLNVGDLWILASVLAWSAYTLLLPHRPAVHPLAFLTAISVTGLLFLSPFYALGNGPGSPCRRHSGIHRSALSIPASSPPSSATSCGIAALPTSARRAPGCSCT